MFECDICKNDFKCKTDLIRHFHTAKHQEHFNEQQCELIKELLIYIQSDDVSGINGIRINSAGGTGKSFVVSTHLNHNEKVVGLGPSNQSVNVLNKSLNGKAMTFHKFFGWKQEVDSNNKEYSVWKVPSIPKGTIFILDEISMMTQYQYALFNHYIYDKFKFILMGDKFQLSPFENKVQDSLPESVKIIQNKNIELSLFFQFKCKEIELTKNMRTKDLELNKYIESMRIKMKLDKEIILQNNWKLDYELIKQNINREYIFITLRNIDVDMFNLEIREHLNPGAGEIEVGDKIRLTKFKIGIDKYTNQKIYLANGDRFTVSYFKKETKTITNIFDNEQVSIDVWYIELGDGLYIYKICKSSILDFLSFYKYNENLIKKLKKTDSRIPKKLQSKDNISLEDWKVMLFKKLRSICDFETFFDFGFASTINKAQGASYDMVFVHNRYSPAFQNKHKYTACSRVINELKIFS